jgi:glycine oxidase
VVIGAGAIGCAAGRALALRGWHVTIVDGRRRAGSASWAAAGMLSPLDETGDVGPFFHLADASLSLYPRFVADVEAASGIDVEFRTAGKLHLSLRQSDDPLVSRLAAHPAGARFGVEPMSRTDVRALEPAIGHAVRAAVLVERDYRVDNRRLRDALRTAAAAAGADVLTGTEVGTLHSRNARVTGVTLADGASLEAEVVINAAGAWSGGLRGAGVSLPVRPVRGQMVALSAGAQLIERVIATPRCYLIPRADGRLLVGATVEDIGFAEGTTPAGITGLVEAAIEALPAAAEFPIAEAWFGFRPATPDGLPVIGMDPLAAGLIHATGHYRNGILLAPITAACVAALAEGEPPPVALEAFAPGRFG